MIYFKVLKVEKLNNILSENLLLYCKGKYQGEKLTESLFAYESLYLLYKEKTGKTLPEITFLNGKPTCGEIAVTLSHSSGVVGVGFSTNKDSQIAIDIEKVTKKREKVASLLGLSNNVANSEFFTLWTQKECLKKALNISLLTNENIEFFGESKIININGQNYALSVYAKEDYEIIL